MRMMCLSGDAEGELGLDLDLDLESGRVITRTVPRASSASAFMASRRGFTSS